jgi:hypothetical protein
MEYNETETPQDAAYKFDHYNSKWEKFSETKVRINSMPIWVDIIWKWEVDNLKAWLLDVKELEWPIECWIKFIWDVQIEMKDKLEIYKIEIQK